jgi:hypothetical protein
VSVQFKTLFRIGGIISAVLCLTRPGAAQSLQASVTLARSGTFWNYTISNRESVSFGRSVNTFYLPLSAPIKNVGAPTGWVTDTDNQTFVLWSNNEGSPYSRDIAPGGSLSGFQFETMALGTAVSYDLASWDHASDRLGLIANGSVTTPLAIYGDLNGDQVVNIQDVTLSLRCAIGLDIPTEDQTGFGDVRPLPGNERAFGNGQITLDDLNWIRRRALGLYGPDPRS